MTFNYSDLSSNIRHLTGELLDLVYPCTPTTSQVKPVTYQEDSTQGAMVALLTRALAVYGCDPAPLCDQAGVEFSRVTDPEARFPVSRVQHLWHLAVEATGDPCIGLTAATQFRPVDMQGLGFACVVSDTLRDVLKRMVRFSRLISTAPDIHLHERAAFADLTIGAPQLEPGYAYASIDMCVAITLRTCQLAGGDDVLPVRVSLMRPRPECADRFSDFFRTPIEFGAEHNVLTFDAQLLDAALPNANPELARVNDRTVIDYLARIDQDDISMRVISRIIEQLPNGTPSQEKIAQSLNTSPRGLQRKLHSANTSFKTLLDITRNELAVQYIKETHRSIGEITYLLGFSEPGRTLPAPSSAGPARRPPSSGTAGSGYDPESAQVMADQKTPDRSRSLANPGAAARSRRAGPLVIRITLIRASNVSMLKLPYACSME